MKKSILTTLAGVLCCLTACADRPQSVTFNELPEPAQTFIETYFHTSDIASAIREKDGLDVDYDVRLYDGTDIDFNSNGDLEEIDCQVKAVPDGIVPQVVVTYVMRQFQRQSIVKYSIDKRTQEVKLSNGQELVFDDNGNFLRYDD